MPRRLGDDPLARAKNATAVQAARAMQTGEANPIMVPASSYNDIFFERRSADAAKPVAQPAPDAPEISEVSELPQIREAAAAPATAAPGAPAKSYLEELVANLNANTPASAQAADAPREGTQSQENGGFFRRLFGRR